MLTSTELQKATSLWTRQRGSKKEHHVTIVKKFMSASTLDKAQQTPACQERRVKQQGVQILAVSLSGTNVTLTVRIAVRPVTMHF